MDFLSHQIQHRDVDAAALADAFDLLGCFDHLAGGDGVTLAAEAVDLFIHLHVAMFIFFLAAAPAWVVAAQFFFGHNRFLLD